jgi:hypothetical protein
VSLSAGNGVKRKQTKKFWRPFGHICVKKGKIVPLLAGRCRHSLFRRAIAQSAIADYTINSLSIPGHAIGIYSFSFAIFSRKAEALGQWKILILHSQKNEMKNRRIKSIVS